MNCCHMRTEVTCAAGMGRAGAGAGTQLSGVSGPHCKAHPYPTSPTLLLIYNIFVHKISIWI